ncbi:hypothetical protein HDE_09819 [Halotydeus destructor]|nr:hypothetical protein HDE_09819 [Halotydeus destructor]
MLTLFSSITAIIILSTHTTSVSAISCYSCSSRNRTQSGCHDPFHPVNASYVTACKVPKEHHEGLFPAQFCVKVMGTSVDRADELVIRTCSLENMDNQCGEFIYENEKLRGCILTCNIDGCNGANLISGQSIMAMVSTLITLLTVSCII